MFLWSMSRGFFLVLVSLISALVLSLSLHLKLARVRANDLGLPETYFNSTSVGGYRDSTFNPVGMYISRIVVYVGIVLGAASLAIGGGLLLSGLSKAGRTPTVFAELLWTFLLSTCWLGSAVVSTMGTIFPMVGNCDNVGICVEVQLLKLASLVNWLLFATYFLFLFTLSAVGIARGKKSFISTAATNEFFSRPSRPINSRSSVTSTRISACCERTGSIVGGESPGSVYSTPDFAWTPSDKATGSPPNIYSPGKALCSSPSQPIKLDFNMSSSMSKDAKLVEGGLEMKAPHPRKLTDTSQFTLEDGSDGGSAVDIPLNEDEPNFKDQTDAKSKPLA